MKDQCYAKLAMPNTLGAEDKYLREVEFDGKGLKHDHVLPQELHHALKARMQQLVKKYQIDGQNSAEIRRNCGGFYVNTSSQYRPKLSETTVTPPPPLPGDKPR